MSALFQALLSLLKFEIDAFEARLGSLAAEDYPSKTAPTVIKFLLRELSDQRDRVALITQDFAHDRQGAFDRLRSEHRKLNLRFPFVSHLSNARTRRVPWSLVPSIERLAQTLVPSRDLMTSCFDEFNYSIRRGEATIDADPFDILFVPSVHRLDAFLHIEIGHELFHLLVNDFLEREQPLALKRLRAACDKYLSSGAAPSDKGRLDQMTELVRNVWRRAVEEIVCDLGCVSLFGPAALMASVSLFVSLNLDATPSHPRYYPPSRLRWRKVLEIGFGTGGNKAEYEQLITVLSDDPELNDYLQGFKDFWQLVEREAKPSADIRGIRANRITAIAYAGIDASLKRGWEFVQSIVKNKDLFWALSIEEIPAHLRSLSANVPCGELRVAGAPCGEPSSLPAIINAAWINELHSKKERQTGSPAESAEDYLKACRLFLKSVEDAELKRIFKYQIAPQL